MKFSEEIKTTFRLLLNWFVVCFCAYILYRSAGDFTKIFETAKQADFVSLAWIMILAVGNLSVMTAIFRANLLVFQQEVQVGKLLPDIMTFSFLTISNPLGANGAGAYIVNKLVNAGNSYLKTLFSFLSTQLSVNIAFFPILAFSFWYLSNNQVLNQAEVTASLILIFSNVVIMTVIFSILVLPKFSISIADFFSNIANVIAKAILKKSLINSKKFSNSIKEIQNTSERFDTTSIRFSKALFFSFIYHLINLIMLYLSFDAYGLTPSIEVLASVYSIIVLFTVVSPTPQGIGIVEGLAHLGAVAIGIQSEIALVVILTYRSITIWLPALLGFIIFRRSKKQHEAVAN